MIENEGYLTFVGAKYITKSYFSSHKTLRYQDFCKFTNPENFNTFAIIYGNRLSFDHGKSI